MAAVCEICGKHPSFGMNVSHSHRRTKRRWNPNIQRIRVVVDGHPEAPARLHRVHQGREGPEEGQLIVRVVICGPLRQVGAGLDRPDADHGPGGLR